MCLWIIIDDHDIMHPIRKGGQDEHRRICRAEHILVCLSSSPSNEKIIRTAAKMARDMRARFTALYVQTGKRERESDKRRLEAHVQFAKESGAEIVMTHGENVPVQIAEYAHLSKKS